MCVGAEEAAAHASGDGSAVVAANHRGTCYVWRLLDDESFSPSFDPFIQDIMMALFSGATLCLSSGGKARPWGEEMVGSHPTMTGLVPTAVAARHMPCCRPRPPDRSTLTRGPEAGCALWRKR